MPGDSGLTGSIAEFLISSTQFESVPEEKQNGETSGAYVFREK